MSLPEPRTVKLPLPSSAAAPVLETGPTSVVNQGWESTYTIDELLNEPVETVTVAIVPAAGAV